MRSMALVILTLAAAVAASAPQNPAPPREGTGLTTLNDTPNFPLDKIGNNDLIGVTVYDAPELTHTIRVSPEGDIRLPMVKQPIHAAGLDPEDLEKAIAAALTRDHVLVDPIVSVSIVEYQSRPITVIGSVRTPVTFQAVGDVTLLDAISRAGGIAENAGPEILVTHPPAAANDESPRVTERISVQSLLNIDNAAANLRLQGGDIVRVPQAGQVYVVGNVRRPGAFYITGGSECTILKALAFSDGLDSFSSHTAYIYRVESGHAGRTEIPVKLKKIMDRKAPDVTLMANDILYVPDASGRRLSAKVLETSLGMSISVATLLLWATP